MICLDFDEQLRAAVKMPAARNCELPRCGGIYERVGLAEMKRFSYRLGKLLNLSLTTGEPRMLYLGIDQHARQITISLRNEDGDVLQARQVSTQPAKINEFFQRLTRERLQGDEQFVAVLEVCGFNDWLIRMLRDYRCAKVILIQPEERKKRKTDRRDAAALSELLWVNRDRLLQGKPVRGLRQVDIAATADQENRRLTTLRKNAGRARTRIVNKVRQILRRHNLQWEMPTKRFPTLAAIAWLKKLVLPEIDRLERDHLLADLEQVQQRLGDLEKVIAERCGDSEDAMILATIPGVAAFTATSLACRVGRVERFPRSHSLANYWGLTPGCRNSGEANQRLGRITKAGSSMARWLLAQVTHKVLRKDARLRDWFKRIKRRRGSTIARVAVMRKLATIIWHMLTKRISYLECRQLATQ
jgi:transposase